MYSYKNILNINKKKIFIVGGLGLIGSEISKCFIQNSANIVIIDKASNKFNSSFKRFRNVKFVYLDLSDITNLEDNYECIIKEHGVPSIFINCSYPKSNFWENKNNFEVCFSFCRRYYYSCSRHSPGSLRWHYLRSSGRKTHGKSDLNGQHSLCFCCLPIPLYFWNSAECGKYPEKRWNRSENTMWVSYLPEWQNTTTILTNFPFVVAQTGYGRH